MRVNRIWIIIADYRKALRIDPSNLAAKDQLSLATKAR